MTSESTFIALMRTIANDPAARGLMDDTAVIELGDQTIILTHDMMAEGVHWLSDADPAHVAWKLVVANLSDLSAKGAVPVGVLLGFTLGDDAWDKRFAEGMAQVLDAYDVPLLGGDTVGGRSGDAPRSLSMTAIGIASHTPVPSRSGAKPGDLLCVTGTLGDASAGLQLIQEGRDHPERVIRSYTHGWAGLVNGMKLARCVNAMMDISDGLLLDASRMADASQLAVAIEIDKIPLSMAYILVKGDSLESRLNAATWGEDFQLLFAVSKDVELPVEATIVGRFAEGIGLTLSSAGTIIPLPATLGYQHS